MRLTSYGCPHRSVRRTMPNVPITAFSDRDVDGRSDGSVTLVERKRGPVNYAKLRLSDGRQLQRKLGPA